MSTPGANGEAAAAKHGANGRSTALPPAWNGHLRAVERALGRNDVDGARQAWESSHVAAVESLSWEGLIATGQACLRIGRTTGGRPSAEPAARRAYFAALYRACRANSFDGILCAAEAFADLGDREVVEECLGLAELQAEGESTRLRVAALVGRLEGGLSTPGGGGRAAGSQDLPRVQRVPQAVAYEVD
jgi:hypothetical protein